MKIIVNGIQETVEFDHFKKHCDQIVKMGHFILEQGSPTETQYEIIEKVICEIQKRNLDYANG